MNRIQDVPQTQVLATTLAPQLVAQSGLAQYRGQGVTAKADPTSMVAEAAEELTFSASETVEKKINKRDVHSRAGRKTSALERAEFYLKRLPDLERSKKLEQFLDHLKRQAKENGSFSARELREQVGKFFKDPSHQFAALVYARDKLADGEPVHRRLAEALTAAAQEQMSEQGPKVRAGLNVSEVAAEYAGDALGDLTALRELYRDSVIVYESFRATFRHLLERHGENGFPKALEFLIRAVGRELGTTGPSIEPARLKFVLDDLGRMNVLIGMNRTLAGLFTKMKNEFTLIVTLSPTVFTGEWLELIYERWLRADHLHKLLNRAGIRGLLAEIYFLHGLMGFSRDLPTKIFDDLESRERLICMLQDVLDEKIQEEEDGEEEP